MSAVLAPLALGFAFGWALQKGRLGRYETIVNAFRFTDLTVVKFLFTALMVALVTNQALVSLGFAAAVPVAQTYALGNLAGGVLFGFAMALAGFCPGTVAAGAGEGRLDYLIPGALGLYTGAVLFGLSYPLFFPKLARIARLGSVTAAQALHVEPWLLILVFCELGLLLFYVLERGLRHSRS
ncbi:MAG: YeeE/YedE thiosulfate transporter family protein [Polyangiales bacterium]